MKSLFRFFGIITPIIAVLVAYFLNQNTADVRYVLSERIPLSNSSECVQQLEIKNRGKTEAQNIQVKIDGRIVSFEIIKHSYLDKFTVQKTNDKLEAIYSELPPQGTFKIILRSSGRGIDNSNISIFHKRGKGTEVFDRSSASIVTYILSSLLFILSMFLLYLSIISGIDIKISSWESKSKYSSDFVLKSRKPFYIKDEKWEIIRNDAIKTKIDTYINIYNLTNLSSYKVLSKDKPDYLTEKEWDDLLENCVKVFSEGYSMAIYKSYTDKAVSDLLTIEKPKHFPQKQWFDLQTDACRQLLHLKTINIQYRSKDAILKELEAQKPLECCDDDWVNYLKYLREKYYLEISMTLDTSSEPMNYIKTQKLDILETKQREILCQRAYEFAMAKLPNVLETKGAQDFLDIQKPDWINDKEYELLKVRANSTLELGRLIKKYNEGLEFLFHIMENGFKTDKPEGFTEEEWGKLLKLKENIVGLLEEKIYVNELREKIQRQLNIIHEFLSDPRILDRIEDYDNTFAPGNFENLKRLATILMSDEKERSVKGT